MTQVVGIASGVEIGGYRVEELIGRGGMGEVYRARDERLDRNVALKILASHYADDDAFRERLLRESRLAASLDHPNVVPVYDAGDAEAGFYLAMRYVKGADLRAVLRREGALSPARAIEIVSQVAGALDAAYANGLVHRDVKPSNVLIDERGHCYLADFGLTQSLSDRGQATDGALLGTLDYVAPEQIRGDDVDRRADVYALGCMLFECLTGEVAFPRPSDVATIYAHLEEEPPSASFRRSGLPPAIDAVFARAMAKEPDERHSSCAELVADASAALIPQRWWRPGRRMLLVATFATAAVGAGIGVLLARGEGSSAIASVQANAVGVIDSDSGKITSQIPVGAAPAGVAAVPDAIWVTNTDDQTVSRIEPRTNAVVQTLRVGAGPAGIAIGAGAVWVVNALDGTVSRIDPPTSQVVQTIPVGNGPTAIAYGLGALWVANGGDTTVSKIHPKTGNLIRTFGAGPGASGIATGFGSVWVTSERTGNLSRLDPVTGALERTINVGNGPRAVAVGASSVWVANSLDGTVSRVDPKTNSVSAVISTAAGPNDIAIGPQAIWVANDVGASLTRIDAATDRVVRTVQLGNRPRGLALTGGSLLVAVRELGLAHSGGMLMVHSGRRGLQTIDPSISYESYAFAIPSLTSDGLVAFKHVGGLAGSTLVPDLALSLPLPTDKGKTYTFELRSGIRYSTGRVVRAEDFRRAIERLFRLNSSFNGYFTGLIGGAGCTESPKTCDLSRGIVVDAARRSVSFRLVAPDPDFLYKLTFPATNPIPPGVPNRDVGTRPMPGTGPYKIARYVPKRSLVFVRNPFFRAWSQAARPAGYPDRIVWRLDVKADAATRAVEKGEADVAYDFVPPELLTEVSTQYASLLHVDPIPGTYFYLLNARVPPFDDVRVRRALNYAVDRDAVIKFAGAGVAQPTCQLLPPNFPGYRPYCPYTAHPSTSGRWVAPDLSRARRLVAASGTKGERVQVWATDKAEGEYVVALLRRLGYRTRLRAIVSYDKYTATLFDARKFNRFQVAQLRWFADYPAASGFINAEIFDCSYFCDRRIDRKIARARALQVTDARAANALWARIDRDLTDQAPWLFLYNRRQADFVSGRVGNFQYNLRTGILLDQLWVK